MPPAPPPLSLNDRAAALADALCAEASALRVAAARMAGGATLVDCGHAQIGGTEAGLRLARICLGGLADVALHPSGGPGPGWSVLVRSSQPVLACLGSQYAGWHLRRTDGRPLLGSGPARALAGLEPLIAEIPHREQARRAVLVLEGEAPPDDAVAAEVAKACRVAAGAVTLLHAATGSLAGCAQIAARGVECALQKARHLGLPLDRIVEATGLVPLAPPHPEARAAMGRANDAIIYGGRVHLALHGSSDAARDLARLLPSRTAPDWGRSFAEVFAEAGGDFARIDPSLFSPAEVAVTALETGETYRAGATDPDRLRAFVAAA